jgi:hypothetical protein
MNGHCDHYLQVRIYLDEADIARLREGRRIGAYLTKMVETDSGDVKPARKIRFLIHPCQEDIPSEREMKKPRLKRGWELYLSARRIQNVERGQHVDAYFDKWLRQVCISRVGVI